MSFIYYIGLFFICQILVEKKVLPQKLVNLRLRYVLLGSLVSIALAMVIGQWLGIGIFLTASVTVAASSIIAGKYRSKFEEMERGKRV
ncbi:hypothetical protein BAU15_02250 [Enterococcus sp. JM4C]|uniref:hypothetical protein n=1 Tax=Candidatus Enterococcus huntleyi TaxID=1857217 RepID=UPI00137B13F8|nr:hypothetical protein [Enterococcus sp. JM4C]KAF1299649.1 hypothetical protein BAU15_02250 [Enterococcus sp. JM4C]